MHLFQLEDVLIELLLELLVCIVDTELLERILLKHFKSKGKKFNDRILSIFFCLKV